MKKGSILLQLLFLSMYVNIISAQELYTGVWRAGSGGYYLWAGVSWQDFNTKWNDLAKQNLRLINIKTYISGGSRKFAGVWNSGTDAYALTPAGLEWAAFNKFWDDNSKKGLRLINVETYTENDKLYFLGVFRGGSDGYALTPVGLDWTAFNQFWVEYSKKGLRLINIESYMYGGKRCFLGVFRAGSGGYILSPYGKDWNQFVTYWKEQARNSQRLVDIETFVENRRRIYLGVWREASDGYVLWGGADWESLTSKWAENNGKNLRLIDLETYESSCDANCLNHALMPDNPATSGRDGYDYGVLAGPQHCEGQPGTCPSPSAGAMVIYRWPNLKIGTDFYSRNSVLLDANDQIFTLPFKAPSSEMKHNAWMYKPGSWHHAIDYTRTGAKTYEVCAAAPGKVIHIGWDIWSGNTIVISHDVGTKKDVYRTIYMHLQNGPSNDCDNSWTKTVAKLSFGPGEKENFKTYLTNTGCPEDKNSRAPKEAQWGTEAKKIDMSLLGKTVSAGQVIAWSGSTGPGGCGCVSDGAGTNTHLHIFFAHRDPTDNLWYFIDPYGIYSYPACYPTAVDGAITTCARYPITWKGGNPQYAQ